MLDCQTKMKVQLLLLVCVFIISTVAENKVSKDDPREPRFISGLFSGLGFGASKRCGECPEHHCRYDEAVVLGYCCGCKRAMDRAPIRCSYHLNCPPSPQPLCSEYDYMMDCCC